MRRRQLLAKLAVTAATAAGAPILPGGRTPVNEAVLGEVLVGRIRDAMLGLRTGIAIPSAAALNGDLARALTDFHTCRYGSLAVRLPHLIQACHARIASGGDVALPAQSYLLATRMLIKLDEQQLGWMAADRTRQSAEAADDPLLVAEATRQLAVLARKADWHDQAKSIALTTPTTQPPGRRSSPRD